jgi:hypothetical protein
MTETRCTWDIDARGALLYDRAIGAEAISVATIAEPLVDVGRGAAR